MNSIFILIPITLLLLLIAVVAWLWSVRSGQFDDLDCEASRILFDDIDIDADVAGEGVEDQAGNAGQVEVRGGDAN